MEELPKVYEPKSVEGKLYAFWEKNGFFAPRKGSKGNYSIVIPPPNVTGVLHMGHALVDTVQDILIRYKRMMGYETVWYPGTDHAGIATQTVVERDLIARTGKRRVDFEREEFLRHVWEWKEKSENHILHQIKQLGCSCDWSKLAFTLDDTRSKAVRTVFKKMFDDELIYKGDYLVNWDPVTETALADDEVEYEERQSFLWHLTYPLTDGSGTLEIATTRPETMLGDTAVAIAPKDERYSHLIGKTITLPITNREIPIIADHYVDPKFGTGVVKITPAHDPNDYAMGQTHNLPMINILTPDGKINENGGEFEGMTTVEARQAVVEKMKELGHFVKAVPHTHRVGISYRSKATIEPYLSEQWFIKMEPFKEKLISAVKDKRVKLVPENWENTYFHWIENLRDWCISRQLWWGHQIPIWYKKDDPSQMICHDGDGLPPEVEKDPSAWEQDPDVLDTWFSSALWPFSIQGWPDQEMNFYPTSTLVTGHDILFFWVARMILMGEYITGEVPFTESFLHGLIYGKSYWREKDEGGIAYLSHTETVKYDLGEKAPKDVKSKWEKMSKSKGNVIDPLEMIDAYGADALR
ncbi:MAG: valine--tRNA ligase, partial [Simkaniaceae bacterium]|nr:valine--tRNA ligase [Simkaniaceae bacterium]